MYVAIDGNNIIHKVWHGTPLLRNSPSPGLLAHVLVNQLCRTIRDIERQVLKWKVKPRYNLPVLTWDHSTAKELRRGKTYDAYKSDRPTIPDAFHECLYDVKQALGKVHPRYMLTYPGAEADDVMAIISVINNIEREPSIIVTRDKDLCQCLTAKDTWIYDPFALEFMDQTVFEEQFGFSVAWWTYYKAIVGDPADKWPGVYKLGPVKVTKLIEQAIDKGLKPSQVFEVIDKQHHKTIRQGLELVTLPYRYLDFEGLTDFIAGTLDINQQPEWGTFVDEYALEDHEARESLDWLL